MKFDSSSLHLAMSKYTVDEIDVCNAIYWSLLDRWTLLDRSDISPLEERMRSTRIWCWTSLLVGHRFPLGLSEMGNSSSICQINVSYPRRIDECMSERRWCRRWSLPQDFPVLFDCSIDYRSDQRPVDRNYLQHLRVIEKNQWWSRSPDSIERERRHSAENLGDPMLTLWLLNWMDRSMCESW